MSHPDPSPTSHITIGHQPSQYWKKPHFCVLIDGEPLDVVLSRCMRASEVKGLVSPWGPYLLEDPSEQGVMLRSIRPPPEASHTVMPLLLCPDDLDFSCTMVVADVSRGPRFTHWNRFGFACGEDRDTDPSTFGRGVRWNEHCSPMRFNNADYGV